jgi:EpsI family protein
MVATSKTQRETLKAMGPVAWVMGLAMAALLAVAFRAPLTWMVDRWTEAESYYSHGFLVPWVALYFVWRERQAWLAIRPERSWLGLACLLAGLTIFLASGLLIVYFTAIFGLILLAWGTCGFLLGRRAMRLALFPAFVLTFMAPLPLETIQDLSLHLKMMVTGLTLMLFHANGISAVNDGATIYLGDAVVTIGAACSGLRSLISLIFLGVLFAAVSPFGFWRRVALLLAAIPIAIAANIVRVYALCMVAWLWGSQAVTARWGVGPLKTSAHDASGYLIFIVAFLLLYLTMILLEKAQFPRRAPVEEAAPSQAPGAGQVAGATALPQRGRLGTRLTVVLCLFALATLASGKLLYPATFDTAASRTSRIPMEIGSWAGRALPVDNYVKEILETNDVIQRNYFSPAHGNRPVQLAVVYSANNRRVAHPPEICYAGGGWELSSKTIRDYPGVGPMARLELHRAGMRDIVLYCFESGDDFTARYYRQQINIVRNLLTGRSTSSALVRLSTLVRDDESTDQAEKRLLDFAAQVMPILRRELK